MKTELVKHSKISGEETLFGTVERITFHNPNNGFSVLKVKIPDKKIEITIVGNILLVGSGEYIEARGKWAHDKSHGLQFQASFLKTTTPKTLDGIEKYLGSGAIKGVGKHNAAKLIKAFKEKIFDVLDKHPERILEIEGIGQAKGEQIIKSWGEQKAIRDIMVFLQSHGVGTAGANRIYKIYGQDAIRIVSENPYQLARDIIGIGFTKADAIARNLGIKKNSLIRAEAGINYTLVLGAADGHCGLPRSKLISEAIKLLEIEQEVIEEALANVIKKQDVVADQIENEDMLFLYIYYRAEKLIARKLAKLIDTKISLPKIEFAKEIKRVEKQLAISLASKQKEAIESAISSKILVITGGPGTGKTTLIKSLINILKAKEVMISLAAPTGRAAKRLSETTGMVAKTIHRLLEMNPITRKFGHDESNKLKASVIIIDEASMIDVQLMSLLLRAIAKESTLIIVGDIDQLPSVGPGNILSDIISSGKIPVVRLNEIFRQASDSLIITNAHNINKGVFPITPPGEDKLLDFYLIKTSQGENLFNKAIALITDRIPKKFGFDPLHDIQVLCPMQQGGSGTHSFNIALQKVLNPPSENSLERHGGKFSVGDKVMQIENNYDKDIYNGDIGFIKHIDIKAEELIIEFDQRKIEYDFKDLGQIVLAYAITIHKSQGSEYPVVIIPLLTQHHIMLRRNLVYTGVTRGKKLVIILGEEKALEISLQNGSAKRYSKLKEMIIEEIG